MAEDINVSFDVIAEMTTTEHRDVGQTRATRGHTLVTAHVTTSTIQLDKEFKYSDAMHPLSAKRRAANDLRSWAENYLSIAKMNVSYVGKVRVVDIGGVESVTATFNSGNPDYKNITVTLHNILAPDAAAREALSLVRNLLSNLANYQFPD